MTWIEGEKDIEVYLIEAVTRVEYLHVKADNYQDAVTKAEIYLEGKYSDVKLPCIEIDRDSNPKEITKTIQFKDCDIF